MRIVVWGINYAPEVTGIAPYNVLLCEYLHAQGHEVEMVTSFAYYPQWAKAPEDQGRLYRTDTVRGVQVHRCWHYVPRRISALKRMVHEASFVATSLLRVLALRRPEALVVVSPPLLLGVAAWIAGACQRAPFLFHVQDLQPDAAVGLGMLKRGLFTRMLYAVEAFAYRRAARVSGISGGMLEAFRSKGVPEERLVYFPNQVPRLGAGVHGRFRRAHGLGDGDFLAIYSGNLGAKQRLGILLDAAALGLPPSVRIVICGDGVERAALAERACRERLANVLLLPLQPDEGYRDMMEDADVCLITQQTGSGRAFFPSKLLAALGCGKPVLTVADAESELAVALERGGFGLNVLPERAADLAQAFATLSGDPARLAAMGARGRAFAEQFTPEKVLPVFQGVLQEMVRPRRHEP